MSFSDEENEQILHATLYKLDSESDSDESSKDTSCDASSDDEEITKLVMAQPWAPTAQKIISTRGPLDPVQYADDFALLIEASKQETTPLVIRSQLATVLQLCATQETIEASNKLNHAVALDPTFPSEERIDALKELETTKFPGNKELAYELRTTLARDKSFSIADRCELSGGFLYSNTLEELKHAITLFKEILSDANYSDETANKILDAFRWVYFPDWPELYTYSQTKIFKILGCRKTASINERFIYMDKLLKLAKLGYHSKDNHESDIEIEALNGIKYNFLEGELKGQLQLKLNPLGMDRLQGSFSIIESFCRTPDNELPPLRGNLMSLLNLIGVDFLKEYQEAEKRVALKNQIEFLNATKTYKPTKSIWDSMIEQAKADPLFMEELKTYFQTYFPNNEGVLDLLS